MLNTKLTKLAIRQRFTARQIHTIVSYRILRHNIHIDSFKEKQLRLFHNRARSALNGVNKVRKSSSVYSRVTDGHKEMRSQ